MARDAKLSAPRSRPVPALAPLLEAFVAPVFHQVSFQSCYVRQDRTYRDRSVGPLSGASFSRLLFPSPFFLMVLGNVPDEPMFHVPKGRREFQRKLNQKRMVYIRNNEYLFSLAQRAHAMCVGDLICFLFVCIVFTATLKPYVSLCALSAHLRLPSCDLLTFHSSREGKNKETRQLFVKKPYIPFLPPAYTPRHPDQVAEEGGIVATAEDREGMALESNKDSN